MKQKNWPNGIAASLNIFLIPYLLSKSIFTLWKMVKWSDTRIVQWEFPIFNKNWVIYDILSLTNYSSATI